MGTAGRGYETQRQSERAEVDPSFLVDIRLPDDSDIRFTSDPESRKAGECVTQRWTPEQVEAELQRLGIRGKRVGTV